MVMVERVRVRMVSSIVDDVILGLILDDDRFPFLTVLLL